MKRSPLFALALMIISHTCLVAQSAINQRADSLLALMTLDEKVGQLVQYNNGPIDRTQLIREGRVGSMLNVLGTADTRKFQQIAVERSRLKIPLIFGFDVIHGYRTTFPIPLATSCTWDPGLIERAERVAAVEATASGINWTFAPMVDIARDPRWGRIAEGAGEDPYLGSVIAAARVRGFQGSNLSAPTSLLACVKHFAAYGAAEGGRDYNTVDISERTLREVYLPPFHAAVRAGAGTLMCSFNEIAGVPSSGNRMLLTDILRGEWGFDGFVVSDWGSIGEMLNHGNVGDTTQAAVLALHAGVDMDMESGCYADSLASAVKQGLVPMSEFDEAVRRILREKFRLGLFDNPYKNCDAKREQHDILTPAHRQLARTVADQSIVLLKNQDNLLPLKKTVKSIALIGPLADDQNDPLGPWSGHGNASDVVTVLQGIKAKLPLQTKINFARGCDINDQSTDGFKEAVNAAHRSDVIVAVVGESAAMSGEAASRSFIGLPGNQEDLLRALQATGKPLVVVLMNGRPLAIPWIAEHVPAIVESWFLGVESGNAIADVLFGDYNPSGKLTTTFPRTTGEVPFYYNHKNTGRPAIDSVKWTSKYIDLPLGPQYPFGYGLSYTTFSYSNIKLSSENLHPNDSIVVSAVVKNTGSRAGEEIAQLYVHDEVASITRPVKELKGFQKVTLKPGESQTVKFVLKPEALMFYNISMQHVVEPGTFEVFVGPNSAEGLKGQFEYVSR
jgi:beta-glucosidase